MINVEMTSTFQPADGSTPRVITIRIGDLKQRPDDVWSVTVDVLGFNTDYHTRAYGTDWLNAIEGAASLLRALVGGKVKDDGGTITPLLLPP